MLIIDDNMFKLAKMQETLLKVSDLNKEENLEKYKMTVSQIDSKAYADILEEVKHIDEHNQSLEDELEFLEGIKNTYNQLFELQLGFKRICEVYGNANIELSDLSKINIDYIEKRIGAISGYLINLKNISVNKDKLVELNDKLIEEEKKKMFLKDKLLELENTLRDNFNNVEGRSIVSSKLVYTSVLKEYEKIDLDFVKLCQDEKYLNTLLNDSLKEIKDVSEKVRVAEACYNNMLSADSKQILNEVNIEYLKLKYKVVMLKIASLLVQNKDNYDEFVSKRESLLELIKYRLSYMEQLGMRTSIDPFSRTKIQEQLDTVLSLTDNSKTINLLMKEISKLNSWVEEMINQNNGYLITLNDTKNLIESSFSIKDVDISSVVSFDELIVKQEVSDNQVISIRDVGLKFNLNKVNQKTDSVIRRVIQMISGFDNLEKTSDVEVIPELVIVPKVEEPLNVIDDVYLKPEELEEESMVDVELFDSEDNVDDFDLKPKADEEVTSNVDDEIKGVDSFSFDIFETVNPFEEPLMFSERIEEDNHNDDGIINSESTIEDDSSKKEKEDTLLAIEEPIDVSVSSSVPEEVMPDAFWVVQDSTDNEEDEDKENKIISFDEQINALIYDNDNTNKTKKKVA